MIEYTNNLEGAISNDKEHAASLTSAQATLLQRLEDQQKSMMEQQNQFMQMMRDIKTPAPAAETNKLRGGGKRRQGKPTRTCGNCGKTGVTHEDDECFSLEKNKDKRPTWWKE